jgi:hypothetical protein
MGTAKLPQVIFLYFFIPFCNFYASLYFVAGYHIHALFILPVRVCVLWAVCYGMARTPLGCLNSQGALARYCERSEAIRRRSVLSAILL